MHIPNYGNTANFPPTRDQIKAPTPRLLDWVRNALSLPAEPARLMRTPNYSDSTDFQLAGAHIEAAIPALANRPRDTLGQPAFDGRD
ncbi:hypothetical protein OG203_38480 [Nocardia sp. NBC_01499]|uniref:hypothetical protein n=1 Tax=Nocardia sp. NBC_01499 TaxID=2903597 RepID=UPI00386F290B